MKETDTMIELSIGLKIVMERIQKNVQFCNQVTIDCCTLSFIQHPLGAYSQWERMEIYYKRNVPIK